ncbi:MAG TPA: GlsB/YeaQ/YmgE family stress response membrane protein [Thermoanaerobaculia bacterium]|nr:GlsB/YeaQ/YmgE family stress response membrane protein [Thermoanaerobaculia bacterium]
MWLIVQLVICVIAGWLTGVIMKGSGYGLLVDLLLGLVGGWIGGVLFGGLLATGGPLGGLLVRVVGAVLLVALVRALSRRRI